LSEKTFVPPDGTLEMEETGKSHKIAAIVPKREVPRELAGPRREIAVRGKKSKSGDRGNKGDGSLMLVCLKEGLNAFSWWLLT
jgi:nuclear pore complex protein Nup133